MKLLPFVKLNYPKLTKLANTFSKVGCLEISQDNLIYLDIEDNFVHDLFPLLHLPDVHKPDYFGQNLIGAHISVVYPEENVMVADEDMHQEHTFEVVGVYSAIRNEKKYYVVGVKSDSLHNLRIRYGLPEKPCYKNYGVDFHITIGVKPLP